MSRSRWQIAGKSVIGASHVRSGMVNQDALKWSSVQDGPGMIVAAVSDGHGSAKCFRSDQGSKVAVNIAVKEIRDLIKNISDETNYSTIKWYVEEKLPKTIIQKWQEAINALISKKPTTIEALEQLEKSQGAEVRAQVESNSFLAFGATLLSVVVTERYIIYIQLGDGDILTVSSTGEVCRPIVADDRHFANETLSLCSPKAWQDFRVLFQSIVEDPPELILMSTDGYANSFRNEEEFFKVGSDFLSLLRDRGFDNVNCQLEGWLSEASQQGSGDDVSLIFLWSGGTAKPPLRES